jgi:hypothetical protein
MMAAAKATLIANLFSQDSTWWLRLIHASVQCNKILQHEQPYEIF